LDDWSVRAAGWKPPPEWTRVLAVDAHTAGEPLRVVLGGFPEVRGTSILARRADARSRFDHLRRALMYEPRGHADMYGCIVVPPVTPRADFGVLFTHNEGFSTMCGHGIIGVVTVVLELGLLPFTGQETRVGIDTPAGFVEAWARRAEDRVASVRFVNVPSFVSAREARARVPGLGVVRYDVAFGGAFYALVEAGDVGLSLVPEAVEQITEAGRAIKRAVVAAGEPRHPEDPDLGFLYGTIFVGPAHEVGHHSRNVCVFAEGEVDRSPTGTGVSARIALHASRGELKDGEPVVIESILGTTFAGRSLGPAKVGPYEAVVPEVTGSAFITGRNELLIDPDDPLRRGFLLR
jgi:proline racemase